MGGGSELPAPFLHSLQPPSTSWLWLLTGVLQTDFVSGVSRVDTSGVWDRLVKVSTLTRDWAGDVWVQAMVCWLSALQGRMCFRLPSGSSAVTTGRPRAGQPPRRRAQGHPAPAARKDPGLGQTIAAYLQTQSKPSQGQRGHPSSPVDAPEIHPHRSRPVEFWGEVAMDQ